MPSQNYSARQITIEGVPVVQLRDEARDAVVSIAPSIGNNSYEFRVHGKNAFWFPFNSVGEFAAAPKQCANPFLAPWANRIDADAYFANGKKYLLNMELGNPRRDPNGYPIHGLLVFSAAWKVAAVRETAESASVVSRLEFFRYADFMAQFPFAHVIEMEYVLSEGTLEIKTRLQNAGAQPMPVAIGYHPYFQIHDAPRESWKAHLAAETVWLLDPKLTPTGETRPITTVVENPDSFELAPVVLDHVFGGLQRGVDGRANFWVRGKNEKIEVLYGPKYNTAVVFAPRDRGDFICFEPMASITNAFNLAERGVYGELASIAPGETWEESYWVRPTGF